jgi:predicted ATP-dependent serine protease
LFVTSAQPDRKELPPGVVRLRPATARRELTRAGKAWTIGTQSSRGSRFVVAEIQSLVSHAGYPQAPARIKTSGVPLERAALMAAVLAKHVPQLARLQTRDVFLNCVGGVEVRGGLAGGPGSGKVPADANRS